MNDIHYDNFMDSMSASLVDTPRLLKEAKPLYKEWKINACIYVIVLKTGETLYLNSEKKVHMRFMLDNAPGDKRISIVNNLLTYPGCGSYFLNHEPEIFNKRHSAIQRMCQDYNLAYHYSFIRNIQTPRGDGIEMLRLCAGESDSLSYRYIINNTELISKFSAHLRDIFEDTLIKGPLISPCIREKELLDNKYLQFTKPSHYKADIIARNLNLHFPKFNEFRNLNLTPREIDIVRMYLKGMTTLKTSSKLSISPNTVKTHFNRLKSKLKCNYKSQIIMKLIDSGHKNSDDWKSIYD